MKIFVINHTQIFIELTNVCVWIWIADKHLRFLQTKHLQCSCKYWQWNVGRNTFDDCLIKLEPISTSVYLTDTARLQTACCHVNGICQLCQNSHVNRRLYPEVLAVLLSNLQRTFSSQPTSLWNSATDFRPKGCLQKKG